MPSPGPAVPSHSAAATKHVLCPCAHVFCRVMQAGDQGAGAGMHGILSPLDELQYWADLASSAGTGGVQTRLSHALLFSHTAPTSTPPWKLAAGL